VTAVSNSTTQRAYIEGQARERGFKNLEVITGDINSVDMNGKQFDRIVSVEMMEHTKNTEALFRKLSSWLKPERKGMLFTHIFVHKEYCYHFEEEESNWMAKYFFSGGTMPSEDMFLYFQKDIQIEGQWRVNGSHYSRTCEDWLALTDSNRDTVLRLFLQTYGTKEEATKWFAMWRTFYLSCSELFAYSNGNEWYIAHYLFSRP
jgi:cyclopropane-fatty-acyl-phospholipid synthase